jgi:hypothetical protein
MILGWLLMGWMWFEILCWACTECLDPRLGRR